MAVVAEERAKETEPPRIQQRGQVGSRAGVHQGFNEAKRETDVSRRKLIETKHRIEQQRVKEAADHEQQRSNTPKKKTSSPVKSQIKTRNKKLKDTIRQEPSKHSFG